MTDHIDAPKTLGDLTRPIIGIENRTAQEVFDIMADRIRLALRRAHEREAVGVAIKPTATQIDAEMLGMPMDMVQHVVDWFWPLVSPPVEAQPAKGVRVAERIYQAMQDAWADNPNAGVFDVLQHALATLEPAAPQEGDKLIPEIEGLIDAYWNLAYAEGQEGRKHDTNGGKAQAVRSAISNRISRLASPPAPAGGVSDEYASEVARHLFPSRWGEGTDLSRKALTIEVRQALEAALNLDREG